MTVTLINHLADAYSAPNGSTRPSRCSWRCSPRASASWAATTSRPLARATTSPSPTATPGGRGGHPAAGGDPRDRRAHSRHRPRGRADRTRQPRVDLQRRRYTSGGHRVVRADAADRERVLGAAHPNTLISQAGARLDVQGRRTATRRPPRWSRAPWPGWARLRPRAPRRAVAYAAGSPASTSRPAASRRPSRCSARPSRPANASSTPTTPTPSAAAATSPRRTGGGRPRAGHPADGERPDRLGAPPRPGRPRDDHRAQPARAGLRRRGAPRPGRRRARADPPRPRAGPRPGRPRHAHRPQQRRPDLPRHGRTSRTPSTCCARSSTTAAASSAPTTPTTSAPATTSPS